MMMMMSWSTSHLPGVPSNQDARHTAAIDLLSITISRLEKAHWTPWFGVAA